MMTAVVAFVAVVSLLALSWELADGFSASEPTLLVVWGAVLLVVSGLLRTWTRRRPVLREAEPSSQTAAELPDRALPAR